MCEGMGSARIPEVPSDWKKPEPRVKQGEPPFNEIDNPGDWSDYTFTAKFEGKNNSGKYLYHKLPTGVTPVPKDPKSGKRIVDGWEFHHKEWKKIHPLVRCIVKVLLMQTPSPKNAKAEQIMSC